MVTQEATAAGKSAACIALRRTIPPYHQAGKKGVVEGRENETCVGPVGLRSAPPEPRIGRGR
jgi:hypothetical protein